MKRNVTGARPDEAKPDWSMPRSLVPTLRSEPSEPPAKAPAPLDGSPRRRALGKQPDRLVVALWLILLAGAALRVAGTSWGLPLQLHPDEWVVVRGAIDMAERNSFEPMFFLRPDHIEMKLSYAAYVAYAHLFHGASPEALFAVDQAPFVLISRLITAALGTAMIVVAYLIGRRFSRPVGVVSAFLVAFYPLYVDHSHYATPDVPLTLALMIVILGCMRYLSRPSWGSLLLACFAASAAIAIKYPGAIGNVIIAVTVTVGSARAGNLRRFVLHGLGAVAAVVGFLFMISPVLFTNVTAVVTAIRREARQSHLGADGLEWSGNAVFYAVGFATGAGILVVVLFALGVMWCIRMRLVESIPLLLGVVYWVILSALPLHWERWALPMHLTPLLVGSIGAVFSLEYARARWRGHWPAWTALGVGMIVGANLVLGSVAVVARLRAPDTRATSEPGLSTRGVNAANTAFEGYTPFQPGGPKFIFDDFDAIDGRLVPVDRAGSDDIRYVVISSDMYDRFTAEPRYAAAQAFYARLDDQYQLVATFVGAPPRDRSALEPLSVWSSLRYICAIAEGGSAGPTIKVFEIPNEPR